MQVCEIRKLGFFNFKNRFGRFLFRDCSLIWLVWLDSRSDSESIHDFYLKLYVHDCELRFEQVLCLPEFNFRPSNGTYGFASMLVLLIRVCSCNLVNYGQVLA
jgi:hypothetical protein